MASKPKFEASKFDKDKGVKEGSKADRKRDAKEMKLAAMRGGVPPRSGGKTRGR